MHEAKTHERLFIDTESSKKFLAYNDSYFFNTLNDVAHDKRNWNSNTEYNIQDDFLIELIDNILKRKTLKQAKEEQKLIGLNDKFPSEFLYQIVRESIVKAAKIEGRWYIPFETNLPITEVSPYRGLGEPDYSSADKDQSIKIIKNPDFDTGKKRTEYLVDDNTSIIHILSNYKLKINRLYTKNEEYKERINANLKD